MNTILSKLSLGKCLTLCALIFLSTAQAQDLDTEVANASKAWKKGNFANSQKSFQKIVDVYGPRIGKLHGPKFGIYYYRKGLTELKLASIAKQMHNLKAAKSWSSKAEESFRICYQKYPTGAKGMPPTVNKAHKVSLQRWAEAKMGIGQYKEALDLYNKFKKERGGSKLLPTQGVFTVNLAICNFLKKEPNLPQGINHLEAALKNKVQMKTSDGSIVAGFLALSQAVIVKKQEQAMVDFLNKNRKDITLEPYQMFNYMPVFMKLAGNCIEAGMYNAALNLYALIPDSEVVVQDINARLKILSTRRGIKDGANIIEVAKLQNNLKRIKKMREEGSDYNISILRAMAFIHDKAQNQRGVFAVLEQLEKYYKDSKKREDSLFNLVRVSSMTRQIFTAEKYGKLFLKTYPDSPHFKTVNAMMLSSLFFAGEYKSSLAIAQKTLDLVEEGSEQQEICLFVLGGSLFYLGDFKAAQEPLNEYLKKFPQGRFILHVSYYQASNLTRLQEWKKSEEALDAFLKNYPSKEENLYMANALYDRANTHFSQNEFPEVLKVIERIEADFRNSVVMSISYNMKGNSLEAMDKYDEAEKSYMLALKTAEARGNKPAAGEALYSLVGLLSAQKIGPKNNTRQLEAIPYYEKFMKNYKNSYFRADVSVLGMAAMKKANRIDEGLKNIKEAIIYLATNKKQRYLEECVNAYTKFFLEKKGNTPELLKEEYYNFYDFTTDQKPLLALLRISLIQVYEKEIKRAAKKSDSATLSRYKSLVKVLFKDLRTEFNPKDLSNFILVKIGDYLREKTSAPKQSILYYEELLSRAEKTGEFKARLGIADVLGMSENLNDNKKAISQLEKVVEKTESDMKTREKAQFRLVEIHAKIEDWEGCAKAGRVYLKEKKYTKHEALVSYLFAKSFDERKLTNDAMNYYGRVYASYMPYIQVSAPSVKRVMEMMWERDLAKGDKITVGDKTITLKIGDRQSAYSGIGSNYVRSFLRNRHKMPDEDKKLFDAVVALVKKYEKSGQVKTVKQLEEERKNRRGR